MSQAHVIKTIKATVAFSAAVVFATTASAQENLSTWGRAKTITLNTSATGANTNAPVTHFPLLVRLDSTQADIFAQSKKNGEDLRFRRIPGPEFPYKIDTWDSAARKAVIWVTVDSIYGNNATQSIYMYWQNPAATAKSNGAATFDSANGFVGAWHMGGAAGTRVNDVAGGPSALPMTSIADSAFTGRSRVGVVGMADSLRGGAGADGGEYFDVSPMPGFGTGFTVSFWAKIAQATNVTWMRFFDFGNGEAQDNIFAGREGTTTSVRFDLLGTNFSVPNAIVPDQWKFYNFTITGQEAPLFVNTMAAYLDRDSLGTMETSMTEVERSMSYVGRSNWATDAYFSGLIDEVQVSRVARSSNWVKLSFESQKIGANMLTFGTSGAPVNMGPLSSARTAPQSLQVLRQGTGFSFVLPVALEAESRITVTDVWGRSVWSAKVEKKNHTIAWDGKAGNGSVLARGMYLARVAPVSANKAGSVWEGKIVYTR